MYRIKSLPQHLSLISRKTVLHASKKSLLLPSSQLLQHRTFSGQLPSLAWLANGPKGFDKYDRAFKRDGDTSKEQASSESTTSSTNNEAGPKQKSSSSDEKKSKANNSGGGKKNPKKSEFEFRTPLLIIAAVLGSGFFGADDQKSGREISWQDFQKQLLETGQVDRIVVTNKNIARVFLRGAPVGIDGSKTATGEFTTDPNGGGFGWNDTNNTAGIKSETADSTSAASRFTRYPTLGQPNQLHSPFYFNIGTVETFERKLEESQRALGIASRDYIPVVYVNETSWTTEFFRFLPTLLLIGTMVYMARGAASSMGGGSGGPGGIFRIGRSPAKRINQGTITTSFKDVAGCDEAKREIMEFVQFLKDPKRFTDLGAKIPRGALLCGPPGTGKTLLARATAGEAGVPFFAISGSDFVEMFVGVGPSRVRDLFKEARDAAPCIIFIDEIDAVGRQRGRSGVSSGGNDERENTLNQLLVEMDGFDNSTNIVILAGTNRVDILDSALTRPGRFDRQITVDRPDIAGRKAIFDIYLKTLTLEAKVEEFSSRLAALTPGFVGADIANICNEAAIIAARKEKKFIQIEDFEAATDRIIGGLESRKIMTLEEKRVVAYHEAGHAVAGWNLEYADPLLKVTIVPRGSGALGYAQYLPKELFLRTRDQILDMVCMALAGRASEEINFGKVTTGAADDLRRVTQIVYQMVTVYGMNERIGQVAFPREEGAWPQDKMYSNATAEVMDEEVREIVAEAYQRTLQLMRDQQAQVKLVAEMLIDKETITNVDIAQVIGKRPYSAGKEYDQYLEYGWKDPADGASKKGATEGEKKQVKNDEEESGNANLGGEKLSPA